jgi:hypothetical protein
VENKELRASSPAASHLFDINTEAEPLNAKAAETFHQITAKFLFLSKRARPDLQTAIAFLATWVKKSDVDNKKILKRVLLYLQSTKDLTLTLEVGNLLVIK